jgi:hypothetical protein
MRKTRLKSAFDQSEWWLLRINAVVCVSVVKPSPSVFLNIFERGNVYVFPPKSCRIHSPLLSVRWE